MLHRTRIWTIDVVSSAEELAEVLTQQTWCCCSGFRLGEYYFVNDATSADGAQEYAALKLCTDGYVQIESLTFSWMTLEQAFAIIGQVLTGQYERDAYDLIQSHRLQTSAEHGRCLHCA